MTPIRLERNISKTRGLLETSNLVGGFVLGMPSNFHKSGRSLGHVTPTIFGIRSNISVKLLELETSNLTHGFVHGQCRAGAQINFPESGRGLGHVRDPYNFRQYTIGYVLATA